MAIAIAAGVGVFLGAQRIELIPRAWSEDTSYALYDGTASTDAFTAAIAETPGDYMAYYRRAQHHKNQNRLDLALADFDRAVVHSPATLSAADLGPQADNGVAQETRTLNRVVIVLLARAELLQYMNRHADALADLDRAIALDARRPSVLFSRATLRTVVGRYSDAIADFDRILDRRVDVRWFFGRGLAKYNSGQFAEAVKDFGEAARRSPADESYRTWLTKASMQVGVTDQ